MSEMVSFVAIVGTFCMVVVMVMVIVKGMIIRIPMITLASG